MKEKTTYNSIHFFDVLKRIVTFCFLLSMTAKPVVGVIFHITGTEYELCENYEETNSEEKEDTTDSGDEDQKRYYTVPDSEFHTSYKSSRFSLQKDLISSHLDIPSPPPDKC